MDEQDIRTFFVPGGFHLDSGFIGGVLIDELDIVLDYQGVHAG